jgi:hypothetical protein
MVKLTAATGGATIVNDTGNIIIQDDDGGGNFTVSDVTVSEWDLEATVTITRSSNNKSYAYVYWETVDGSAQDESGDNDYKSAFGEFEWLDGDETLTRTVTIPIVPDAKEEGPEMFTVSLLNIQGSNVTSTKPDGIITIMDPIPVPTLSQWAMGLMSLLLLGLGFTAMAPSRRKLFINRR